MYVLKVIVVSIIGQMPDQENIFELGFESILVRK